MDDAQSETSMDEAAAATSKPEPDSHDSGEADSRAQGWQDKIKGHKAAFWWGFTALLGVAAISMAGTPTRDNANLVLVRLLFPVFIMLIYAWIGYNHAATAGKLVALRTARISHLADSLYFLGFLWTLWALIDSFVIHEMTIAEAVFRTFGYALVTTATGMFLRLLLLQFGYSAEDQVELGERKIEAEIGRFSKEVADASASIRGFKDQTDLALTKWIKSLNEMTSEFKTSMKAVQSQTTGLKKKLEEMGKVSNASAEKEVRKAVATFINTVKPSYKSLNKSHETFVKQIIESSESVKTRAEAISQEVDSSTEGIEKSAAAFADTFVTELTGMKDSLATVSRKIQEITVPPDIVRKALSEQNHTLNAQLIESTRTFTEKLGQLSKTMETMADDLKQERKRSWLDRVLRRRN